MSETSWFFDRLRLAVFRPRQFADVLAREHFGLAGLIVAGAAGSSLALALDLLLVVSGGGDPTGLISRFLVDALLVGVRATVLVAVVGAAVALGMRAIMRHDAPSIDQLVTAAAFGLAPLIVAFPVAAVAALAPVLVAAAIGFVILVGSAGYGFSDELDHARFLAYRPFPQLAPPLSAAPVAGTTWTRGGMSLVIPPDWERLASTTPGTLVQYQRGHDTLAVVTKAGGPLLVADELADRIGESELRGVTGRASSRDVVRIGDAVVVDDRVVGTYEGSRLAVHQLTSLIEGTGYAVILRSFEPDDPQRVLDEAASIAATWHIAKP